MEEISPSLLLADDDIDDHIFFRDALEELSFSTHLTIVNNGVDLMRLLYAMPPKLPDMLFLDLNMPLKTGFDCLSEIKSDTTLKSLPVIIFSTSYDPSVAGLLYEAGAHYYLRKPGRYDSLRTMIHKAIHLVSDSSEQRPGKEDFLLHLSK